MQNQRPWGADHQIQRFLVQPVNFGEFGCRPSNLAILGADRQLRRFCVPTIKFSTLLPASTVHRIGQAINGLQLVQSSWASKVSEIGQQALLGAEGAEESQGHKAFGFRRP